jgi:small subunit ribosomal protein S20
MANTRTAQQNIRLNLRRAEINRDRRGRIRTFIKKVEAAIQEGNQEKARDAFKQAQPEIHRGVNKGILHKNTAGRKISRLSAHIKALSN